MEFESIGKVLLSIGALLIVIGGVFLLLSRIGVQRLPGDIFVKRGNFSFYFPIVTCIVISLVLTFIASIINRFR